MHEWMPVYACMCNYGSMCAGIWMCVCVCVCMCMRACVRAHEWVCVCVFLWKRTREDVVVHVYVMLQECLWSELTPHSHMHVCLFEHSYKCSSEIMTYHCKNTGTHKHTQKCQQINTHTQSSTKIHELMEHGGSIGTHTPTHTFWTTDLLQYLVGSCFENVYLMCVCVFVRFYV